MKKNNSRFRDRIHRIAAGEDPAASSFYSPGRRRGSAGSDGAARVGRKILLYLLYGSEQTQEPAWLTALFRPATERRYTVDAVSAGSLRTKIQTRAAKIQKSRRRYERIRSTARAIIRLAEKLL